MAAGGPALSRGRSASNAQGKGARGGAAGDGAAAAGAKTGRSVGRARAGEGTGAGRGPTGAAVKGKWPRLGNLRDLQGLRAGQKAGPGGDGRVKPGVTGRGRLVNVRSNPRDGWRRRRCLFGGAPCLVIHRPAAGRPCSGRATAGGPAPAATRQCGCCCRETRRGARLGARAGGRRVRARRPPRLARRGPMPGPCKECHADGGRARSPGSWAGTGAGGIIGGEGEPG
jgi:hypothetical protein